MRRQVSWFSMQMNWLVFTCCEFLLRGFLLRVAFIIIFNCQFSCVKTYNCSVVYSEIPLGRNSFSRGDRSLAKHCRSIDFFLHGTPDSLEGFSSESLINNLCFVCDHISNLFDKVRSIKVLCYL